MARRVKRVFAEPMDGSGEFEESPPGSNSKQARKRNRGRRGSWLLILALVLGLPLLLTALLPQLLRFSTVRNGLIAWAAPQLKSHLQIGGMSGGWIAPITIQNIAVTDLEGQPLANISTISTDQGLWSWAVGGDLATRTIRIQQPAINVLMQRDGTTNAQRFVQALVPAASDSATTTPRGSASGSYEIVVQDGSLKVSQMEGPVCHWQQIEATITTDADITNWRARAEGIAAGLTQNDPSGRVAIRLNTPADALEGGTSSEPPAERAFFCQAQDIPWQWWADSQTLIPGTFTGEVTGTWPATQLHAIQLAGTATVISSWGQVSATAKIPLNPWQSLATQFHAAQLVQVASQPGDLQLEAEIPLEKWAGVPALRRDLTDTQLVGAPLRLKIRSNIAASGSGEREVELTAEVGPGQIVREGIPFAWQEPMTLGASATSANGQVWFRQFACRTPFLQAAGAGSSESLQAQFQANLAQGLEHFRSYLPTSLPQLGGEFDGHIDWSLAAATDRTSTWQASGTVKGKDFRLAWQPDRVWQERALQVQFTSSGTHTTSTWQVSQCDSQITLDGDDRLNAKLVQPLDINDPWKGDSSWEMSLRGDVRRWQMRSMPFAPGATTEYGGQCLVSAKLSPTPNNVTIADCRWDWQRCQARGDGWTWQEPRMQGTVVGALTWSPQIEVKWEDAAMTSTSLALRARQGTWAYSPQLQTKGQMQFRGNISRMMAWAGVSSAALPHTWGDQVDGQLSWDTDSSGPLWNFQAVSSPVRNASGNSAADSSPLHVTAQGRLEPISLACRVDQIEARVPGLQLKAETKLVESTDVPALELTGTSQYDLAQLVPLAMTRSWGLTEIHGSQSGSFHLSMPWSPSRVVGNTVQAPDARVGGGVAAHPAGLSRASDTWQTAVRGEMGAGWDGAQLLGLPVGPGRIDAQLADGMVKCAPIQAKIGAGQLSVQPTLDLRTTEPIAYLQTPAKLDQLDLTPEVCRGYLKYVAPLIAEVADARGNFSVNVAEARLPAYHPETMQVSGQITIHEAAVGPGPLSQQILQVVQTVRQLARGANGTNGSESSTWFHLPTQTVSWQVEQGRVYHEGMMVRVGDVELKTKGWVAFDESLQLVVEVPIREGWVAEKPWLKSLAGTSIQLPVGGTLRRPQVDQRGFAQWTTQAIQSAAQERLGGEVQKQVEKQLLRLFEK